MVELTIPEELIDEWIREDVGPFDLTTFTLGIEDKPGEAEVILREEGVVCGLREAARVYQKVGAEEIELIEEGKEAKDIVMRIRGPAGSLHKAWRVAQNIVALASGVATYTRMMIKKAKKVNPKIKIIVVRKAPPCRWLYYKGVICGGGSLHRTSLSDTVVLFKNHVVFTGLEEALKRLKESDYVWDKKIVIEVENLEEALKVADYGFDMQVDHLAPSELRLIYEKVKERNPSVRVLASGGIKLENVEEYAFVDAILTSAPYWARPLDVTTKMAPL